MRALDKYLKYKGEVYDYFNFKEEWKMFPLSDSREVYWVFYADELTKFCIELTEEDK